MRLKPLALLLGLAVGAVWGYAGWSGAIADAFALGGSSPAVKQFDPTKVTVVFLDVGQGDCIFIHTPNGRNVLVDAGEGPNPDNPYGRHFDAGTEVIVPFLRDHGVTRLDAVVMTHPHSDHIGGLEAVLAMEDLEVKTVYYDGLVVASKSLKTCLRLIKEKHEETDYRTIFEYIGTAGAEESEHASDYVLQRDLIGKDILEGDPSAQLLILGPLKVHTDGSFGNNNSIVNLLRAGNVTVLLTGDAEVGELGDISRVFGEGLRSVILKVPHHGSKATSLHNGFIQAVKPTYTIYQVGAENNFGHPHKLTFERYQSLLDPDPVILRNDLHGDIVLTTDGKTFEIGTEKHPDPAEVEIGREFSRGGRRRSGGDQG